MYIIVGNLDLKERGGKERGGKEKGEEERGRRKVEGEKGGGREILSNCFSSQKTSLGNGLSSSG